MQMLGRFSLLERIFAPKWWFDWCAKKCNWIKTNMIYQMNGLTVRYWYSFIYLEVGEKTIFRQIVTHWNTQFKSQNVDLFLCCWNEWWNERTDHCHCHRHRHCIHFSHTQNEASDECLVLRIEFKVAPDYCSDFTCSISIVRMWHSFDRSAVGPFIVKDPGEIRLFFAIFELRNESFAIPKK